MSKKIEIAVDTNILILLISGNVSLDIYCKLFRTKWYREGDFIVLSKFLNDYGKIITTPHILTETSNIIRKNVDGKYLDYMSKCLHDFVLSSHEFWLEYKSLSNNSVLAGQGITDYLLYMLPRRIHILTDDFALHGMCRSAGRVSHNFNSIRAEMQGLI